MNSAPRFETIEINDADLDTISGGVAAAATSGLHVEAGPLAVCADLGAFVSAQGVAAHANADVVLG
ncbi:hypothetical protein ACFYZI_39135 [Streptomyces griseorubiginosus]|uniref:Uncharacterized protein n=1 Tax=Streptomyces griseorubiginosus TaxID=67304 RepID=A0A101RYC2_9ACTN|nr:MULTISPECIES: hypothetical protein [Streptomyces]AYC43319.1 hypothetical protein DWG14_07626 [Streptomyces griseorubiginosus]KUM74427.1 hypothetical protein AQI84_22150 [Streptomyces griseorubiginosus]KUN63972.1 hypothetical protein AQJ54_23250 [Streptomyces griseorubiginosus]TCR19263.1 hypothetical protein EV578_1086 [Streptomyces sp. BK205]